MFSPTGRRWARRFALQALYQWELSPQPISDIEERFMQDENRDRADLEYFKNILHSIVDNQEVIQTYIKRYADRPLAEIDPIELSILRIAISELLYRPDVPYKVVLNEALELGKLFGATDGYKFVNGLLDKSAREIRREESM